MDESGGVQRAAVLIGVSRTGGLPTLQAVTPGIARMKAWARAQGFASVTTLIDDAGPVTVAQIQQAIAGVLAPSTVEQLVVYFAGHGVNIGQAEYWLLSGAPTWTNEAVNVDGSARFARYCGVAHVVLISDCCRTAAAAETTYQSIDGAAVFPNTPPGAHGRAVDRFYACALGSPALEVRPEGADGYTAVYTATLTDALGGDPDSLLERTDDAGVPIGLVRPWPLQRYLENEVGRRLMRLTGSFEHTQVPDAVITSDPAAWLSRLERPGRPTQTRGPEAPSGPATSPAARARAAVRAAFDDESEPHLSYRQGPYVIGPQPPLLTRPARIVVRGTAPVTAESLDASLAVRGDEIEVDLRGRDEADVLVRFANGTCALVPALRSYTATMTFDGPELAAVAWDGGEPGTAQIWDPATLRTRSEALSTAVQTAVRLGALRLTSGDAELLAEQALVDPPDPTLALHSAYALADVHREDLVEGVAIRLAMELGVDLFDLALISGRRRFGRSPVAPAVPLLARGWALLDLAGAAVREEIVPLRRHLVPSIWTLFDDAAVPEARDVLLAGRNR